ncbi:hypothetical protein MRX96_037815 [Rhipicephalus microplus]
MLFFATVPSRSSRPCPAVHTQQVGGTFGRTHYSRPSRTRKLEVPRVPSTTYTPVGKVGEGPPSAEESKARNKCPKKKMSGRGDAKRRSCKKEREEPKEGRQGETHTCARQISSPRPASQPSHCPAPARRRGKPGGTTVHLSRGRSIHRQRAHKRRGQAKTSSGPRQLATKDDGDMAGCEKEFVLLSTARLLSPPSSLFCMS